MSSKLVQDVLQQLRTAADAARQGFPTTTWRKESGPGPDEYTLTGGHFRGSALEPDRELVMSCEIELAETDQLMIGQPLEGTLDSLYPLSVSHDGREVFQEDGIPVAYGPALFTIVPQLVSGNNGAIRLRVRTPNYQTNNWIRLRFSTPALRARFEALDIAWSQLWLANAFATTAEEQMAVQSAANSVGSELAIDQLAEQLKPLRSKIAAMDVHLIGHSHIDMNWLWRWPDTVEVIRRDLRSVLALMDEFPELTFSHSQPATYEVMRQHEPELFKKLLAHIRAGRWEATTMQWVEPDCNMPAGESHARQLLEGVRYSREVLGVSPTVFHAPDTFGHAGNLPQLAVSAGAKYYYHHRANPGKANLWPAYWWEGHNGDRLFAFSTPGYNGQITASEIAIAAVRAHKAGHPAAIHFHGIGDHGGGPSRHNLQTLRNLQATLGLPSAKCSTMAAYAEQIISSGVTLPVHRCESSTIFEGCYTTHADTKRYNRAGENLLLTAETLAALSGQRFDQQLSDAWRKVLFNQFHDILDGSAIHESYLDHAADFESVALTAKGIVDSSLQRMSGSAQVGEIAVTNPLSFSRTEVVTISELRGQGEVQLVDSAGQRVQGQYSECGLLFVATVPGFSTAAYRLIEDSNHESPIPVTPDYSPNDNRQDNLLGDAAKDAPYLRVETPHFSVYLRRDCGIIVSLFDKRIGRELVGFGMRRGSDYIDTARPDLALNVLQILDEYPHGMSSWQLHEVHSEQSLIRGGTTRVLEKGPVRCVIETTHTVRSSTIIQRIIFYSAIPRIDFETHVDWKEIGDKNAGIPNLKVAFNARLDECQAWFETPFAAVRRPADGQETPALRWADVGGSEYGVALLNDDKYGYDVLGCRLRLSLLRSAYDPDAVSDVGSHDIRYALVPHPGDWREARITEQAAGFNQPLLARLNNAIQEQSSGWHPNLIGDGIQISALKPAYGRDGVVIRLYESNGRRQEATLTGWPPKSRVIELNIVEDQANDLATIDNRVSISFAAWQVRTLLIVTE